MRYLFSLLFISGLLALGCNTNKSTTETTEKSSTREQPSRSGRQQGPPSIDQLFELDQDGDGKLSKSEVKGRIANDFDKIDADGDGFLTREEVENAPRPRRGQRPGGGQG